MNKEKIAYIRVQDDLYDAHCKDGKLFLPYKRDNEFGKARNTSHWSVNSIVGDHAYGKFNENPDGSLKGKYIIIGNPKEMPVPAGLGQVDTWFRLDSKKNANGELDRGLSVGKDAVIIAPYGESVPENANVIRYDGTKEGRDSAVEKYLTENGIKLEVATQWGWQGQNSNEWAENIAKEIYPEANNIHFGGHTDSIDELIETNAVRIQRSIGDFEKDKIFNQNGVDLPLEGYIKEKIKAQEDLIQKLQSSLSNDEKNRIGNFYENLTSDLDNSKKTTSEISQNWKEKGQSKMPPLPTEQSKMPPLPNEITHSFSVHQPKSNKTQDFTDAREAGAAFFNADRTERPGAIHVMKTDGRESGRIMADTEVHGTYSNGEQVFVKTLPNSHQVDAEFRAGYWQALEQSVNERLKTTDWEAAKSQSPLAAPNLHPHLSDDLQALARKDFEKAAKAWEDHAPKGVTPPAIVDREWKRQNEEARQIANVIDASERGLTYGAMTLDDKPVTSIRFERSEKDGEQSFNVSFYIGSKPVDRLKGIDADTLADAVGDKNAKTIVEHGEAKGSLKGETLMNEYGITPEENARRAAMKDARKERKSAAESSAHNLEGTWIGKIISVDTDTVVQKIGRTPMDAVTHRCTALCGDPFEVGQVVAIKYTQGHGLVHNHDLNREQKGVGR